MTAPTSTRVPAAGDGVYLGIDIGGTKVGLCVGTPDGAVLVSDRVPTDNSLRPEALMGWCKDRLARLLKGLGGERKVLALGVACPGPLDYKNGAFINPPNSPTLHGFRLRAWLDANLAWPCAMMNDANAAAYAEWLWGAARGTRTAVFLTCSTGMGSGLVIDGRLYEGPLGLAGEIGRIKLGDADAGPVGFGRRGSVEGYCSGPGMSQLGLSEAIICAQTGERTVLRDILASEGSIPPERLCEAAMAGDPAALRATDRVAKELGRLMAVMTDILNPEVFALGTIVRAFPDLFIPGAVEALREWAIPSAADLVRVVPSGLTDHGNQQALAVAHYTFARAREGER
jgi:glucokinase